MKHIALLLIFSSLIYIGFSQRIIHDDSVIKFKIGSVMWSKVKGELPTIQGDIYFDKQDLDNATFNIKVPVKGINTNNEKRDAHLLNEDFFEVETYPFIRFKSSEIIKVSEGYEVYGELTIKDVTKEITIPFITIADERQRISLVGHFKINRLDYNIGTEQSKILVDKMVDINIVCIIQ